LRFIRFGQLLIGVPLWAASRAGTTGGSVGADRGHALGLAERAGQRARVLELARAHRDHAGRQGRQRVEAGLVLAVQGLVAAGRQVLGREEAAHLGVEVLADALQALGPVLRTQHHHEVVAADMADEVQLRVGRLGQHAGGELDDVVADAVAVDVVEGLEVVDVPERGHEGAAGLDEAVEMVVDRHIARQQGQRVGIARRMHLQVGDGHQQVRGAAGAEIAAAAGDDEAVGHQLLVQAGQGLAHGAQPRVGVEDQRVAVHQLDAAAAGVDGEKEALQAAFEHMARAQQAEGAALVVQHRHGVEPLVELEHLDRLLAAQARRDGRGAAGELGGRRDRIGRARQRVVVELQALAVLAEQSQLQVAAQHRAGGRAGAGDQIALVDRDAEAPQHVQVGVLLQAFGDDGAAAGGRHLGDRAHELLLERLLRDAVDEVAVDLDEVGPDVDPALQARKAFAEVVQGQREAGLAQRRDGVTQAAQVLDRAGLGQLDDDARARQVDLAQLVSQLADAVAGRQQAVGRHVDEGLARQCQLLEATQREAHEQALERHQLAGARGHFEQHQGRVQRAVGRAAGQGLEAEDLGPGGIDQGLEMDLEALVADEPVQLLIK
jgi:hypothetical protein